MKRFALLMVPFVMSACLPLDVAVVEQSSTAVIDGVTVSYNEDYLAVSRQFQALQNTREDQVAARAAVGAYCGNQGLGYLDRSSSFNASDMTWRFRGNCVLPDGTPVSQ
ncbi:hypothetical protein [Yoonia sp. 208BN28-4]|uniref:hypothetical protein n=1 Tax=Yoonia sp. 208BN28-4 TaxID=3126505 RepID=UPI00309B0747